MARMADSPVRRLRLNFEAFFFLRGGWRVELLYWKRSIVLLVALRGDVTRALLQGNNNRMMYHVMACCQVVHFRFSSPPTINHWSRNGGRSFRGGLLKISSTIMKIFHRPSFRDHRVPATPFVAWSAGQILPPARRRQDLMQRPSLWPP